MNPIVLALKQLVQLVSAHLPHSFAKCYEYRLQLQALMITDEMPLLWITFNPSDLQCPIVLWLARVSLPISNIAISAFKIATATMNPVAIATSFNEIYKPIFDYLLAVGSMKGGFLEPV